MPSFPQEVEQAFARVTKELHSLFSLDGIRGLIELQRNKPLLIEGDTMPVGLSGYCLALKDVDLICTRIGLDEILTRATILHEFAHLLLGHVPLLQNGAGTPTYAVFVHARDRLQAAQRDHSSAYAKPEEQAAEILATLLLRSIEQEEEKIPQSVKYMYGYEESIE